MKKAFLLSLCMLQILLSGCVSSVSVKEARTMQEQDGFFDKNLHYYGSTDKHHYFNQLQHETWLWCVLQGKPTGLTPKTVWFKVPFYELYIDDAMLFPYGIDDEFKIRSKISSRQPYYLERCETLNEKLARFLVKFKGVKQKYKGLQRRYQQAVDQLVNEYHKQEKLQKLQKK